MPFCTKPHSNPQQVFGPEKWCIIHGNQNDRFGNYAIVREVFPVARNYNKETYPKLIDGEVFFNA